MTNDDIIVLALAKKYVRESLAGAGALKGDPFTYEDFTEAQLAALKGEDGKSAYEIAVENGYSGTEKEWLASLKGAAFKYSDFTAEQLAGLKGAAFTYDDFTPEQLAALKGKDFTYEDFTAEQLAALKGPKGDSYTITSSDYDAIAEKVVVSHPVEDVKVNGTSVLKDKVADIKVPTTTSELTNNSGYITLKDLPESSNSVEDVKVNGISVVTDKVANITFDGTSTIGRSFTTDITVGHLEAGTVISADQTLADILYKILYAGGGESTDTFNIYFGSITDTPSSTFKPSDLTNMTTLANQDINTLVSNGLSYLIKTGDAVKDEAQHTVIAYPKKSGLKLVNISNWTTQSLKEVTLDYTEVTDNNDYTIYYLNTLAYDEDWGGNTYLFTFEEVK